MRKTLNSSGKIPAQWLDLFRLIPKDYDILKHDGGYFFDVYSAERACKFIEMHCSHVKGSLAGQQLKLEDWQRAVTGALFGWKDKTGNRRFREAFIYVPRKNGKTTWVAGIINYVLMCDNEDGAEIYSAAADRDQASLIYQQAAAMIERNPTLSNKCQIYKSNKSIVFQNSSYKAISADAGTKHGYNSHFIVVDELHAQPNRELVDVLETSTGARTQPIFLSITTSDFLKEGSICNEKLDYARSVASGHIDNHRFLPVVYEANPEDDWKDPETWKKCNPNLGVSVSYEYLEGACKKAQQVASYENTFKRLHLNIQTESDVRWLPLDRYDICKAQTSTADILERFKGHEAFGGVDLSSTQDLTCCCLGFPVYDDNQVLSTYWLHQYFLPETGFHARMRRDKVPFDVWKREGWLTLTDGDVVDYRVVKQWILDQSALYDVKTWAFDPWNGTQLMTELQDERIDVVKVNQTYTSLSDASKELEKQMVDKRLNPGDNSITRWCAGNVTAETDGYGNIRPSKKKSTERIDGIAAMVNSLALILGEDRGGSVYAERGILTL